MAALGRHLRGSRVFWLASALALAGGAGLWVGTAQVQARAAFGYLAAFTYAASTAGAAVLILMLGYVANAEWMSVIRRLNEVVALALLPLALLFVPLVLMADQLYVWLRPEAVTSVALHEALAHKRPYLNLPFFVARSVVYFAVWTIPLLLLRRWSLRPYCTSSPCEPEIALSRQRALSSAMLLPGTLAMTFCAFDWLMSLEPAWLSTSYGLYYLSGGAVAAVAIIILLGHVALRAGLLREVLTPNHFHALGRVLLTFTILWAYVAYFQLFLISIADEPSEVVYYLARSQGSWRSFGQLLALGHFAAPVLLLLPRAWKFRSGFLAAVSAWLLLMHYADVYYLSLPVLSPESAAPHWVDLAALAAIIGTCTAFCAWLQRGVPLVAEHDPLLARGLGYRSEL